MHQLFTTSDKQLNSPATKHDKQNVCSNHVLLVFVVIVVVVVVFQFVVAAATAADVANAFAW